MARKTIAGLELELARSKSEFAEFKVNAVEVARRYAEEHGLCSVVDEALAEIGLIEPDRYRLAVVYEFTGIAESAEMVEASISELTIDEVIFDDDVKAFEMLTVNYKAEKIN